MNYTVCWLPDAEQELAALWLDASLRSAVTQAAYRIDQQLERSPQTLGESRPNNLRIHFQAPLGVLFRVQTRKRLVEIVHVWKFE